MGKRDPHTLLSRGPGMISTLERQALRSEKGPWLCFTQSPLVLLTLRAIFPAEKEGTHPAQGLRCPNGSRPSRFVNKTLGKMADFLHFESQTLEVTGCSTLMTEMLFLRPGRPWLPRAPKPVPPEVCGRSSWVRALRTPFPPAC